MTLFDIIERGYFPKELPPPFNTKLLANHIGTILPNWGIVFENNTDISSASFVITQATGELPADFKRRKKLHRDRFISKYSSSKGTVFSISKGKLSRRFLQIPNPKHFSLLSEKIANKWTDFEHVFALSEYSKSYPVPETNPSKRSVSTVSKSLSDFRTSRLQTSFGKIIEVSVDISKFYPTIYTHSVAWGLLGKDKAKSYFKQKDNLAALIAAGDADAALYKSAEEIDIAIRSCQERQSIGIPIGPDTSHILAEIVACRIDSILKTKFDDIGLSLKACRYYDDYYLYVSTRDEADKVLKGLQLILADFQLEINESKVTIKEFPFAFEDEFATRLLQFVFKKTNLINSLKHYFSLIWGFVEKNSKRPVWVVKYSLRVFEYRAITIPRNSWSLFEDLLFKTALIEPSVLDIMARILLTYNSYLDVSSKSKLKDLINTIVNDHCPLNHNFEVSWALWIAKTFNIEIDENSANKIIDTRDSISNLILLDLINTTGLVHGSPNINALEIELKDDILFSENWLLAYESVKKGWLVPANANLINDNLFFKMLHDLDVEFYDPNCQLVPYPPNSQNSPVIPTTHQQRIISTGIIAPNTPSGADIY